eukprot:jgi/Mesvir1/14970/Mv14633-RA.1
MAGETNVTVVRPYDDESKIPLGSSGTTELQPRVEVVSQHHGSLDGYSRANPWRYLTYNTDNTNNSQPRYYHGMSRNSKAAYARLAFLLLLALAMMALALAILYTYHGMVSVSTEAIGDSVTVAQLQKLEAEVDTVVDRLALGVLSLGQSLRAAGAVTEVLANVTSERARDLCWSALSAVSGVHRMTYGTVAGVVGYRRADLVETPTSRVTVVSGSSPFAGSYVDLLMSVPADPTAPQGTWLSRMFPVDKSSGEPFLDTPLSIKDTPAATSWPWFQAALASPLANVTWSLWPSWGPCSNLSEGIPGVEMLNTPADELGLHMSQLTMTYLLASSSVPAGSNGADAGGGGDSGGRVVVSAGQRLSEVAGFLRDSPIEGGRMFLLLAGTGELVVASHGARSPMVADRQPAALSALNSSDPVIAAAARHLAERFQGGQGGGGLAGTAADAGLCWELFRDEIQAHGRAWKLLCRGRVYGRSAQLPLVAVILTPVAALESIINERRDPAPRVLSIWIIILAAVTFLTALATNAPFDGTALYRRLRQNINSAGALVGGKIDPQTDDSLTSPKEGPRLSTSGHGGGGGVKVAARISTSIHGGGGGVKAAGRISTSSGHGGVGAGKVVPLGLGGAFDTVAAAGMGGSEGSRMDLASLQHGMEPSIDMRTPLEKLHNILGELSQGVRQPGPEVLSEMAKLLEMPDPHMPAIFQESDVVGNLGYQLGMPQPGKLTMPSLLSKHRPKAIYEEVDEDTQRWLRSSVMRIQGTVNDRRSRTSMSAETPFFTGETVPGTPMDSGTDTAGESLSEWTVAAVAEALRSPAQLDDMQLKLDPSTGLPIMIPVGPGTPQRRSVSCGNGTNNAFAAQGGIIHLGIDQPIPAVRRMQRVSDVLGTSDEARRCLASVGQWNYDTWKLEKASNGMPTLFMGLTLYQQAGLLRQFHLPQNKLIRFLSVIDGNMCNNDYHNSTHVADVANSTYHLIKHSGVGRFLSRIDVLAAITAALVHDYKHPGRNNDFLVRSEGELALFYNDRTVLENMHVAEAFKLLRRPDLNFLEGLDPEDFRLLRATIIEMVLGSDLKRHFEILDLFKKRTQDKAKPLDPETISPTDRVLLLQVALKVADIGHSAKSLEIHKKWTDAITEEFFKQGDEERRLKLPVSSFMDRLNTNVPKSQTSFFKFIAMPLFEAWAAAFPASQNILDQMLSNIAYWETQKHTPGEPFWQVEAK